MSVEGIWKVEMLGPYGWENVSTAFLEDGRYLAASQDHYVTGSYEVNGNRVRVIEHLDTTGRILKLHDGSLADEQPRQGRSFRQVAAAIAA